MAKGNSIYQAHQGLQISESALIFTQVVGGVQQERIALEEGAIENGVIKDIEKVRVAMTQLAEKIQLKRKDICLMLPEHIVYVRMADLNGATASDQVGEAIEWEVKQHLPGSPDEMHMDWKLIAASEAASTYQVVAVERTHLQIYLQIVKEVLNAKVVAVETPSLALVRLLDKPLERPVLLANLDSMATLAVVDVNKGIHVTSVDMLDESSGEELQKVVSQMVRFAKRKHHLEVGAIVYVGALESLGPSLATGEIQAEGVKGAWGQSSLAMGYLLAEKPVTPPADPETINLMPVEFHGDYEQVTRESYGQYAAKLSLICLLVLNLVTLPFLVMGLLDKQAAVRRLTEVEGQSSSLSQAGTLAKLESQVGLINQIGPKRAELPALLRQIAEVLPAGIELDSISLDTYNSVVSLSGVAATADDLLTFKDSVEEVASLKNLQIPLNVFEKQEDIAFSVTFMWDADLLLTEMIEQ